METGSNRSSRMWSVRNDVFQKNIRGDSQLDFPGQSMKSSRASGVMQVWMAMASLGAGACRRIISGSMKMSCKSGVVPLEGTTHNGLLAVVSPGDDSSPVITADAVIDGRVQCDAESFNKTLVVLLEKKIRALTRGPFPEFAKGGFLSRGRKSIPAFALCPGYACQ